MTDEIKRALAIASLRTTGGIRNPFGPCGVEASQRFDAEMRKQGWTRDPENDLNWVPDIDAFIAEEATLP